MVGIPLTLASARRLTTEIHRQRAMGRDVVADYEASQRRQKVERETLRRQHVRDCRSRLHSTVRHEEDPPLAGAGAPTRLQARREWAQVIPGGLADRWSDKAIADIERHDVYGVVDETRRKGVPGLDKRKEGPTESRVRAMFSTLSKFFSWLVQHRRIEKNPCGGVHRP